MPTISIILTTYNHKDFIKDAIESIINQSFYDWELLIWDDSPNNDTREIVNKYTNKYPNKIKAWHHNPNKWIVDNMNFLIDKISTDSKYVVFLEWDDILKNNYLDKKLKIFDKFPKVGLIYNNIDFINYKWNIIQNDIFGFRHIKTYKNSIISPDDYVLANVWPIISWSTVMVKKEIADKYKIKSIDPSNKSYAVSDYDFLFNVSTENEVFYINESLTLYRRHASNLSAWNINLLEQLNKLVKEYYQQWKITKRVYKNKTSQNNVMISLMLIEKWDRCGASNHLKMALKRLSFNNIILKLWAIVLLLMPQKFAKEMISMFVKRW